MSRFVIFNQYPARMRYQEWWEAELEFQFKKYFDDVITIPGIGYQEDYTNEQFSPAKASIIWEATQIQNAIEFVKPDDILFFCDISYPGLSPQLAFHFRENKKFGYCHATSMNNYDIFEEYRNSKYLSELSVMQAMDKVFFGTEYSLNKHYKNNIFKLQINNSSVVGLPKPSYLDGISIYDSPKQYDVGIISRRNKQKVNEYLLDSILQVGFSVGFHDHTSSRQWEDYLSWIHSCRCIVSLANEETYGYQVMDCEAVKIPFIAPNKYSYPEVVVNSLRYNDSTELIKLIRYYKNFNQSTSSMSSWAKETSLNWFENVSKEIKECL